MENRLRAYLMGQLSQQEEAELEEEYLTNPQVLEQLEVEEEELIYAYARQELSELESKKLEQQGFFNSVKRQQKLAFARTVATYLSKDAISDKETPTEKPLSWWQAVLVQLQASFRLPQAAMATALILMVIGGVWLYQENARLKAELAQTQQQPRQTPTPMPTTLPTPSINNDPQNRDTQIVKKPDQQKNEKDGGLKVEQPKDQATANNLLAVTLIPITVRDSGDITALTVKPGDKVELKLTIDSDMEYKHYRVDLQKMGAETLWQTVDLKVTQIKQEKYLIIRMPNRLVTEGNYLIRLNATNSDSDWENIADYPFSIKLNK